MNVFNRVLDGDDVGCPLAIDPIDQGGEGRAFSGACRSGDQHQAFLEIAEVVKAFAQSQFVERSKAIVQFAKGDGGLAGSSVDIEAKTSCVSFDL